MPYLLILQIQAIDGIIMKGFEEKFMWKLCEREKTAANYLENIIKLTLCIFLVTNEL